MEYAIAQSSILVSKMRISSQQCTESYFAVQSMHKLERQPLSSCDASESNDSMSQSSLKASPLHAC